MIINSTGFDAPALYQAQVLYAKLYGEEYEQVLYAFQDPAPHETAVISRMIAYVKDSIQKANLHFADFVPPDQSDTEAFYAKIYGDDGERILSAFRYAPRETLVLSRMITYLRAMLLKKEEV